MQKPSTVYRYPRDVMVTMRELVLSRTRPSLLSNDFDNDDGLFSPDKWMQYRWQCEGIETRPLVNKKKLKGDGCGAELEQTVLSPQRRGFSSGCRAPSPRNLDEERASKSRWRQSQLNNGGVDFKPAFQKSALDNRPRTSASNNGQPSVWRNSNSVGTGGAGGKPWAEKSNRGRHNFEERSERVPEWLDEGPSSMTDIIELKGFEEDDVKEKKSKKKAKTKDSIHRSELNLEDVLGKKSRSNSISQNSRPSSRALETLSKLGIDSSALQEECFAANEANQSPMLDPSIGSTVNTVEAEFTPTKSFPNSDAEFAAYLGLLDICDIPATTMTQNLPRSSGAPVPSSSSSSNQPSTSRLSRFFSNKPAAQEKDEVVLAQVAEQPTPPPTKPSPQQQQTRAIVGQRQQSVSGSPQNTANSLPPMLQQLFANAAPKHVPGELSGVMTVEELERNTLLGRPSTSHPARPSSRPDEGSSDRGPTGFYIGPQQHAGVPTQAAINAFLQAQFHQNRMVRQAAAAAAAAAIAKPTPSEFNGIMTVEELERNTLMSVHPSRLSPANSAGQARALDLNELARQGNFLAKNTMQHQNPAAAVAAMNAAALMQAQMHHQQHQQNMMQQQQQQHAQHHQQQQHQQKQQNLLLQQAPLPVLQKLFASANSPSSSSSSPPSTKFKYPPPSPQALYVGVPQMQFGGGAAPGGNHTADSTIMDKILAHQAALNNGYIAPPQAGQFPPNFRLPMPMFEGTNLPLSLAEQHQQLSLAVTRGDLVAAQAIRSRMIAQALAGTGAAPFHDGNQ